MRTILFLFLFFNSILNASQNITYAKEIANLTKTLVYNMDTEELPSVLIPYLEKNKDILALNIIDNLSDQNIISFYRDSKNNKLIFNKPFSLNLSNLEETQIDIKHRDETIGKVIIFYKQSSQLDFSQKERDWLEKNQIIKYVYDNSWRPLEWRDDLGKHKGIIADFIKLLDEKSGIDFQEIKSNSWSDAVNKVKSKKILMFSGVGETKEKKEYLNFTKVLLTTPYVLISRQGENYLNGFKDIKNKKIGVPKDYAIEGLIKEHYPDIQTIGLVSVEDGYKQIIDKDIDIFVTNGVSAMYHLNLYNYKDMKIAYKTDLNLDLKIGLHKDMQKEVLSILNKTIEKITKKEIDDIIYKYTNTTVKEKMNWNLIWGIIVLTVLIILFFIMLNRRLRQLVDDKTEELKLLNDGLESKVKEQTKNLKRQLRILEIGEKSNKALIKKINLANEEIHQTHKNIRDSIEYASLIQGAIIPSTDLFRNYFKDYFLLWYPKDIVGGDIYFFSKLRDDDEALLMVIDCTGHSVSGAFVTMIVKAIERNIVSSIMNNKEGGVSPANILSIFNKSMKHLLKQYTNESLSDVGFDAQILYFNRKDKIVKYAGARNPIFYIQNNKLKTINGDRSSVGYVKSKIDFKFTEHIIDISTPTTLYISTDGYWDQCGGKKKLPFGKVRLKRLIEEINTEELSNQQTIFLDTLHKYEKGMVRNDDITFIGLQL